MKLNVFVELLDGSRKQIGGDPVLVGLFGRYARRQPEGAMLAANGKRKLSASRCRAAAEGCFEAFATARKPLLTGPDATPSFGDGRMQRC